MTFTMPILCTADADTNHHQLSRTPEAMTQGLHRLAHGKFFHAYGRKVAHELQAIRLEARIRTWRCAQQHADERLCRKARVGIIPDPADRFPSGFDAPAHRRWQSAVEAVASKV